MSNISDEYINTIVSKVASDCHFSDYKYKLEKFESIGQNYFGIVIPVLITGKNKQQGVILKVVLKLAPTDERYRISGAVTLMFNKEVFVYSTLLSKYKELQKNFSAVFQFIIPKCYYTSNEYCKEVIVMQNLCEDGYRPFTREQFLDINHITVSLESLAKLHALSFILKNKDDKLYNKVTNVCLPLTEKNNKRYMDIMKDRLTKALQKFADTHYVPLLENLKQNCDKYFDEAVQLTLGKCICHGDVWKENILFKYKDNKPKSACLIDYQTTRMSSPAFDTLYLIISSTHTNLRRENYGTLLNIYYRMFDEILNEVGLESHILYSRQNFNTDLKIVASACLITANTALWLSNGLQEDGHVKSKHVWTTDEEKQNALDQYKGMIKAIIDDFYIYGYFS